MRIHRRFLYFGVFFIALGATILAADYYGVDSARLEEILRLWPLALIAIGVALVLGRTRFSIVGGMLAAAIPGLVLGSAFALGPHFDVGCAGDGQPASFVSQQGTFDGPANVDIAIRCATVDVNSTSGSQWQLESGNTTGAQATVSAASGTLSVAPANEHGFGVDIGRDVWRLSLPTTNPVDMAVHLDAGSGTVNLGSAQLRALTVRMNAGALRLDASNAALQRFDAKVNVGSSTIQLPDADFTGTAGVDVGDLRLCAPSSVGVRITSSNVSLGSARYVGLNSTGGGTWETPNYASATHKIQLGVTVNVGSFTLNTLGGC